jgi:hypothetical protein
MNDAPAGQLRTDPFLSLDPDGLDLRDRIINETRKQYRAAFQPRLNFTAAAQFDNPQTGDLVLELTRSSVAADQRVRAIGFGYLVGHDGETWWVQYGPNADDVCEWGNCLLIRVPDSAVSTCLDEVADMALANVFGGVPSTGASNA